MARGRQPADSSRPWKPFVRMLVLATAAAATAECQKTVQAVGAAQRHLVHRGENAMPDTLDDVEARGDQEEQFSGTIATLKRRQAATRRLGGRTTCSATALLEGGGSWVEYNASSTDTSHASSSLAFDYTCTCPHTRARHVCTAHREGRDIWVPAAVADGSCKYLGHDFLAANPLPPGANVLFAGNSHMRQVVEALLCMFQGAVSSRKVLWGEGARTKDDLVTVGPDTQCRKCIPFDSTAREKLVDLCGEMQFNCACSDDLLMVDFTNGASLAYQFLRGEANKTLASVTANFSTPLAEFDAVVFNHGNSPPRPVSEFLDEVEAFLEDRPKAPPPVFFWTSTLFGRATEARNLGFNPLAAEPLGRLHLNTIPVFDMHDMMGIGEAPEASREHERVDLDHYCQPGPVSDVALVLAHAVWAALKGLPPAGPPLL